VTIRSEKRVRAAQQSPFLDDPTLRRFFGDRFRGQEQSPQYRREGGLGSGVIVSNDGYILTNHHVVDGAELIKIEMTDNRSFDAKVVGTDQLSDLALLKINAQGLQVLSLGDSDRVRVGDVVLAIGNPLGVGQTVTMGIISAKGRATGLSDGSFEDFLQTDAPINQGNSGGALVNTSGELVGINSQILTPSGGSIGIGFAIPSNMAKNVMDQLSKSGKVRRGKLGIGVQQVNSDIAASLGLKEAKGTLVNSVESGSPAEKAGVHVGDVITGLNGSAVADMNSFRNHIASTAPGTEVSLTVMRDGGEKQFRVTLAELPARKGAEEEPAGSDGGESGGGKLGLRVEPLTPQIAAQLNLKGNVQGLVVDEVDPAGPAAEAGIQQGDVIVQANRQQLKATSDLVSAVQKSGDKPVLLLVNRQGQTLFVPVHPRK
jgi:Do/DeqQ family serine protease